jgi:cell division protein FtsZ
VRPRAGGDWTKGREAARASRERLDRLVAGADLVFVAACMGGGTGASGVVAEAARAEGALRIGVATHPFRFEGRVRSETAETGIGELCEHADALIVVPNDRLSQVVDRKTTLQEAFEIANDVLRQGVQGIADLIANPGVIDLDLANVRTSLGGAGEALLGIGHGRGDDRSEDAARQAVASPLLELSIDRARRILFTISAGPDLTVRECERAAEVVRAAGGPGASIVFGAALALRRAVVAPAAQGRRGGGGVAGSRSVRPPERRVARPRRLPRGCCPGARRARRPPRAGRFPDSVGRP